MSAASANALVVSQASSASPEEPSVGDKRRIEAIRDPKSGQIIQIKAAKKARVDDNQQQIVAQNRDGSHVLAQAVKRTSSLAAPTVQLHGHQGSVLSCRFNPTGSHLVSAGKDHNILVWEVYGESKNEGVLKGHMKAVLSLAWSHSGSNIYSAGADSLAMDWDAHTGELKRVFRGHRGIVNDLAATLTGDQLVLTASDDKSVRLWDERARFPSHTFKHEFPVTSTAFSRDGTQVFTGGIDEVIRCWEVRKKAVLYELPGHTGSVTSVSVSPDGSFLLSAAADHSVRSWDVRPYVSAHLNPQLQQVNPRALQTFLGSRHDFQSNLIRCSWSSDSRHVTAGSADGMVNVWESHSAKLMYKLPGHKGCVNDVDFHPKEPILLSCSDDGSLFMGELNL